VRHLEPTVNVKLVDISGRVDREPGGDVQVREDANATPRAYGMAYLNGTTLNVNYSATTISGGSPLISAFASTTPRNNFTGWVGTKFTVGGTGVTVTSLGRL
jgi:hypothetical protein